MVYLYPLLKKRRPFFNKINIFTKAEKRQELFEVPAVFLFYNIRFCGAVNRLPDFAEPDNAFNAADCIQTAFGQIADHVQDGIGIILLGAIHHRFNVLARF